MSIALNISDKKVGKSNNRKVGRCFGFIEMVPVVGSITMFWRPESVPDITRPLDEPGAAMYGNLLGSGVFSIMLIGSNLDERRHFFTRMSSWLKDHSSAERREARFWGVLGGANCWERAGG